MILIFIFLILFLRSGFSWTDGKPLAFVNWYTNEPYPLNRHLCAGFNSGSKWQDEPCYLKFPSICKRPLGKRHYIYFLLLHISRYLKLHYNDCCEFYKESKYSFYFMFSKLISIHLK